MVQYLVVLAVLPILTSIIFGFTGAAGANITLGGTGLLIIVGVAADTTTQMEAAPIKKPIKVYSNPAMKTHMIFVGPPGAGKGSHAKIVSERLGIPHISTGDIFRKELKNEKLIALVKSYTDHGQLVPDEITNEIVRERFQRDDVKKGFILDGYPRNPSQAAYFDKLLAELGMKLDVVFNITSETDMILFRITGRRTCPTCRIITSSIIHQS